jgi:hypothetical protein
MTKTGRYGRWPGVLSRGGQLRAALVSARGIGDLVTGHGASGYGGVRRHQRLDHMPRLVPTHFGGATANRRRPGDRGPGESTRP